MAAEDVEAGRAYVTLYLRRVGFDQQVEQARQDTGQMEQGQQANAPQQPYTEAGITLGGLKHSAIMAAAGKTGSMAAEKAIKSLLGTATAAAPAVAAVGTAAAGTATSVAAVGTAAAAAAPAVAASGTAAAGASVGFAGLVTAALPILLPLAAIAAAAGMVYVVFVKWNDLSTPVKLLLVVLSPLVLVCRAMVLAFQALKLAMIPIRLLFQAIGLAVSAITAPFRLAAGAVGLLYRGIMAIPGAIAALPGLFMRAGQAAWNMGTRIAQAAGQMAASVGRAAAAVAASLAKLPGQLAGYASSAVSAVSSSLQSIGMAIGKAGAITAGLSAAIVGPMSVAAKQFADYSDKIRGIQNEYQRFALTAEEASVISRVSEQTGESIQKLAEQMREGTRDFSRWNAEVTASGQLMTGSGLGAALALSRAYYALQESLSGLRNTLGSAIAPAVTEYTQVITGGIRAVIRWASENKPLIAQIFRVATIVGAVATGVTTFGGAIAGAGAVLSPFTAVLAAIAAGLALLEWRTGTGRSLWASYGDAVRRVYTTVVGYLGQMMDFAQRVMGGIKNALIAGDLAAAVNILWAGAKVAWISALVELDTLTRGMFGGLLQNLAAGRWAAAGEALMNELRIAWATGITAIAGLWTQVVDAADAAWVGLQTGFDTAMGALEKAWIGMFESLKAWGADFLKWMANSVLMPLAKSVAEYSSQAAAPIFSAAAAASSQGTELKANAKTPDELAAEYSAVDNRNLDQRLGRENDQLARQAERQSAADALRLEREQQIADLRQRQAALARQGATEAAKQLAQQESGLQAALDAAKAAREAADAARPKEEDFAVSTRTESLTAFSGASLELMVGRKADDPQKRIADLSQQQLAAFRILANDLNLTLKEVMRLAAQGGFS